MTVTIPRPQLGSGIELIQSALTVPYSAAMRTDTISLIDGSFVVPTARREPALLIRLKRSLADEAIVVTFANDHPVVFSPFSAEGTLLPGVIPQLAEGEDGTGPFTVDITAHRVIDEERLLARPLVTDALSQEDASELLEAVLLEGRFARLLYLTTLEKQRCIRQAREIAALRHRTLAHTGALDQRGLDLGVPRLAGDDETDEHYRARLAIYTKWRLATPAGFNEALNGPGNQEDDNAGLPSLIGVKQRFTIVEEINDLSVATKLVAVGSDGIAQRTKLHQILQKTYLVDLDTPTPELVPTQRRAHYEAVRATLDTELTRTASSTKQFMAPLVATTLDRTVRLLRGLGYDGKITLKHAYDPAGGSRYELGLGVDIEAFNEEIINKISDGIEGLAEQGRKDRTNELGQLALALQPRAFSDDPLARWLFEPCGFRTVHAIDDKTIHLSPLPSFGQWIDGPTELAVNATGVYESRYHSGNTATGIHVRAKEAADETVVTFNNAGLGVAPPILTPAQLKTQLEVFTGAAAAPPVPSSLGVSTAAGIVSTDSKVFAKQLLDTFNLDQVVAFEITKESFAALGADEALRDALVARVDALTEAGFYSVRGVWDDSANRLLLLASVSQLPGASSKIGEPPPASFYWYETRLPKPSLTAPNPTPFAQRRGGRATTMPAQSGLSLLVCIGYARRGLADPFEVRIELEDPEAVLNMDQYGYLMNLLEFLYPIGIEINTFDIRRRHVDADGDGNPEFLTSRASRTYHRYAHRRPFGSGRGRDQRGLQQ